MLSTEIKYHSTFKIDNILFTVVSTETGIRNVIFNLENNNLSESNQLNRNDPRLHGVYFELQEYFKRERRAFSLPLDMEGTDFQKRVWNELLNIPFGQTISYKTLAKRLGNEKLIRAFVSADC